jgi:hypothetical protein
MIVDVRITHGGTGAQLAMAAARARTVAHEGNVARVYMNTDPKAAEAVYVWKDADDRIVTQTATFIEAKWLQRLQQLLTRGDSP